MPIDIGFMTRDISACFESWAEELLTRANRVRNLIGDAHWLSDGHHKEEIVREFLARYVAPTYRLTRGFICPVDNRARVSPEIDILISDSRSEPPWFHEGGLIIAPPSAAVAQIHVKTRFGCKELEDVLRHSAMSYQAFEYHQNCNQLWCGGIFFSPNKPDDTCIDMVSTFQKGIHTCADLYDIGCQKSYRFLPDCLAILQKGSVFLVEKSEAQNGQILAQVRAFECGSLPTVVFLAELFAFMATRDNPAKRRGELVQYLQGGCSRLIYEASLS